MNRVELRQAVAARIAAHSDWSDRRLALACVVSRDLVADIRRALIADGRIERDEWRQGRDGKVYKKFPRHSAARQRRLSTVVDRLSKVVDRLDMDSYLRADLETRSLFHALVVGLNAKLNRLKRDGAEANEIIQVNGC